MTCNVYGKMSQRELMRGDSSHSYPFCNTRFPTFPLIDYYRKMNMMRLVLGAMILGGVCGWNQQRPQTDFVQLDDPGIGGEFLGVDADTAQREVRQAVNENGNGEGGDEEGTCDASEHYKEKKMREDAAAVSIQPEINEDPIQQTSTETIEKKSESQGSASDSPVQSIPPVNADQQKIDQNDGKTSEIETGESKAGQIGYFIRVRYFVRKYVSFKWLGY